MSSVQLCTSLQLRCQESCGRKIEEKNAFRGLSNVSEFLSVSDYRMVAERSINTQKTQQVLDSKLQRVPSAVTSCRKGLVDLFSG